MGAAGRGDDFVGELARLHLGRLLLLDLLVTDPRVLVRVEARARPHVRLTSLLEGSVLLGTRGVQVLGCLALPPRLLLLDLLLLPPRPVRSGRLAAHAIVGDVPEAARSVARASAVGPAGARAWSAAPTSLLFRFELGLGALHVDLADVLLLDCPTGDPGLAILRRPPIHHASVPERVDSVLRVLRGGGDGREDEGLRLSSRERSLENLGERRAPRQLPKLLPPRQRAHRVLE